MTISDESIRRQRIAIIGTGISGLTSAHLLCPNHDIKVYEANGYIGGHTNTIDVSSTDGDLAIDTGFIVFNDRTYPNFLKILTELGVAYQPTSMSFSVRDDRSGLEYNGTSLNRLFSQRRNLVSPAFYRLLNQILSFNRKARKLLEINDSDLTLGEFLKQADLSPALREQYLYPMGAALWSANPRKMEDFPALYFAQFFDNHGLLGFGNRPDWFVIKGGSREYVRAMTSNFADRIHLDTPVKSIRRYEGGVDVYTDKADPEKFDRVVIACHSDQALKLLSDPSDEEREILGALPYQPNIAVLHTDISILPKRRLAWGAWNYLVTARAQERVSVTYDMKILQNLQTELEYCVTLNQIDHIHPDKIIKKIEYHHPVYTVGSLAAQRRRDAICGKRRTYYAGAYWGFGFHEDGVKSAMHACAKLGVSL